MAAMIDLAKRTRGDLLTCLHQTHQLREAGFMWQALWRKVVAPALVHPARAAGS